MSDIQTEENIEIIHREILQEIDEELLLILAERQNVIQKNNSDKYDEGLADHRAKLSKRYNLDEAFVQELWRVINKYKR